MWVLAGVEPHAALDGALATRLGAVALEIPPLGARKAELPELANAILAALARRSDTSPPRLAPAALARLGGHAWPGDLAELEAVLARAFVLAQGETIEVEHVVLTPEPTLPAIPPASTAATGTPDASLDFLLAELAHELKNPLVTIKTFAQHLPALLEDGPRDHGQGEQEQDDRSRQGPRRTGGEARGRKGDGIARPGGRGAVRVSGHTGQAHPDQETQWVAQGRGQHGLGALGRHELGPRESAAAQDRQLERLPRQGERGHSGQDGQGHGTDLEHHQVHGNAEVRRALLHHGEEIRQGRRDLQAGQRGAARERHRREPRRQRSGLLEGLPADVQVHVPHEAGRQLETVRKRQIAALVHDHGHGLLGVRRWKGVQRPEPVVLGGEAGRRCRLSAAWPPRRPRPP